MPSTFDGEVESPEALRFQQSQWRIERVAWIAAVAVLAAAAAGIFGTGPWARATARTHGLAVEYSRFLRTETPDTVRIAVDVPAPEIRVALDRRWVERLQIDAVTPEPDRVELGPEWHDYVFARAAAGPTAIVLHLRVRRAGRLRGRIRAGDGEPVRFTQLAYP